MHLVRTTQPHDSGIDIPNHLERAFNRMNLVSISDIKFHVGDWIFRQKPRTSKIKIFMQCEGRRKPLYVGNISIGRFHPISKLDTQFRQDILHILQEPKKAAIEYGKSTGQCACCGRDLSDPASLLLGIGPICLNNFGWADDSVDLEDL